MRVLIVKLSSLGDVVHTLPVVADIRAAHRDADAAVVRGGGPPRPPRRDRRSRQAPPFTAHGNLL